MNRYFRAEVTDNFPLNKKTNLLSVKPLESVFKPLPGQFYMIELGNSYDPLLKRPFSYFRSTKKNIQFLYAVRGRGTSLMKDFKRGMIINMVGPLGSGYPEPRNSYIPLLVAGGIGIASIFPLAETFVKKACILYGAKNKDEILMLEELKGLTDKLIISTDDGSFGKRRTVIDALNDFLSSDFSLPTSYLLYACGPRPMLEAISNVAYNFGIKGYVSLEENMACGVGACMGCAVKTINGYKRVCKEGPVFPIEEIVW
ncbi:MAG: dihydroorotate dehydrogenase electron transfer subunit [Nitrospirota bacterium]